MSEFEKLGLFYIGRRFDADTQRSTDEVVLYDSKDLVTHAFCVGMTGSGKTGLGVAVIEEAAIDGVPAIVIDPKGDLTNLLLTFPDLAPADFLPWVGEDEARRAGMSRDAFAAEEARTWQAGLAEWGQDGARIARLRAAAEFTIYTPGSTAGVPVSMFTSFARPDTGDAEMLRERVQAAVSSLLALAGLDAEPQKSREHILLSTILLSAWQEGESPDLALLLQRIQQPPMSRIGVMDLESFFPAKERFSLAMSINALLASPGFDVWSQGEPLDVAAFLRTPGGKPRVSIFSIAHLDDSQRMFFVALLLNAVAGWMRTQAGTSSLRALVYMDEIFGFFPPVADPPSKRPLLTLLKQGRAAGVGVVLGTQNPVDLDYKGLSNIGTWWLGRLQTERDKARVLDGLEGAHENGAFNRGEIDRLLSALTSRVFLMRNVHEDGLTLFQSRWALSYLRGPLGRDEIKRLMADRPVRGGAAPESGWIERSTVVETGGPEPLGRPVIPPGVPEYFAPDAAAAVSTLLEPALYGAAQVRFVDPKAKIDVSRLVVLRGAIGDDPAPVDWQTADHVDWAPEMLEREAPEGARFSYPPAPALKPKNYETWSRQLAAALTVTESLTLFRSRSTGEVSRPDETERDFRARLQQASREARDRALDALRRKYSPRQGALEEKLRRARQAVGRESGQASGQKLQTAISVGATLVGALFGRKAIGAGTIGRATTVARGVGRSMKESEDIERAKQNLAAIEDQRRALDEDLRAETSSIEAATDAATEQLETLTIRPKKTNITVKLVALVWALPVGR